MSTVKRIVCLANAHKDGARCVAGKELLPNGMLGDWIRPLGRQKGGALSERERQYLDGDKEPALLDVIEFRVDSPKPESFQRENWNLAGDNQFKRVDRFEQSDLAHSVESPRELWVNGHDSPNGRNNRIPDHQAEDQLTCSLYLIKVDRLQVSTGRNRYGKENKRGEFQHGPLAYNYRFNITDPAFEGKYADRPGVFTLGETYLTVSLTLESDGYAYKLIAAVMPQENA